MAGRTMARWCLAGIMVVWGVGREIRCSEAAPPAPTKIEAEAEWSGFHSRQAERAEWVITTPEQWAEVWKTTHPNDPPSAVPEVDFSSSFVIGVAFGEQPTGGYGVHIAGVFELQHHLLVAVEPTAPAQKGSTAPTQPYHLVQVPRSPWPVLFNWPPPILAPDHD